MKKLAAETWGKPEGRIVPLDAPPTSQPWTAWLQPDAPMTTLCWVATCTFPNDPVVQLLTLAEDMTRQSSAVG